jgi:hypothetical protein
MKLITESMLRGACKSKRVLFRETFPDGAPVTMAAARKAQKAGLNVLWLAEILPEPLHADYYDKCTLLHDDYLAKRTSLHDDYLAKRIKLLLACLRKAPEGGRA